MNTKQQLGHQKRVYNPHPDYRANQVDIKQISDSANMLRRIGTGQEPPVVARELARQHSILLTRILERMTGEKLFD